MKLAPFFFVVTSLAVFAYPDYWKTQKECEAATTARYYWPSILKTQKLATGEAVYGNPNGGCADMDLPDRIGGRGWVRTEPGRLFVYNEKGEILRLMACNNKVYAFVPFPPPPKPLDGKTGSPGSPGQNGERGLPGPPSAPAPAPVNVDLRIDNRRWVDRSTHIHNPPSTPAKKSWLDRNKKWLVPVALAGGAVAGFCGTGHCGGAGGKKTVVVVTPPQFPGGIRPPGPAF